MWPGTVRPPRGSPKVGVQSSSRSVRGGRAEAQGAGQAGERGGGPADLLALHVEEDGPLLQRGDRDHPAPGEADAGPTDVLAAVEAAEAGERAAAGETADGD